MQEKSREEAAKNSSAAKEEPERLRCPSGQSGRPEAKGFEQRACVLAATDINEVMVSLYIMLSQLLTLRGPTSFDFASAGVVISNIYSFISSQYDVRHIAGRYLDVRKNWRSQDRAQVKLAQTKVLHAYRPSLFTAGGATCASSGAGVCILRPSWTGLTSESLARLACKKI